MIQDRLRPAQSKQNAYVDNRFIALRYGVGDQVFINVSPMKGVIWFGRKEKLRPRYIGSFEILHAFSEVSYELDLSFDFFCFPSSFYVNYCRNTFLTLLMYLDGAQLSWISY